LVGEEAAVTADQIWVRGRPDLVRAEDLAVLFRKHHADLVRLAVLIVRDQPTAEDVVQDVFARLHARNGHTGRPGHELAYIRASVLNGCRSVLRRRVIARRLDVLAQPAADDADTARSAEAEVVRAEERRRVLEALAALPPRRREVLVLRYYLGLSEAEIAATLGISPGSVKSAASRGMATLARELGEDS
jgi:RNA polymerase sigma-70 factor (sigma-E family)